MKAKTFTLFFFIILFKTTIGQEYLDKNLKPTSKENAFYYQIVKKEKGRYNITIYRKYDNLIIQKESYLDKNLKIKDGQFVYYSESSKKISKEEDYLNNKINGFVKIYIQNSDSTTYLFKKSTYIDSLKNGIEETYAENGSKIIEANYKNGRLNGLYTKYNLDWGSYETSNYLNDKLEGKNISYYKSGKIASIRNYKDGVECDSSITYYENSNVKSIKIFVNKGSYYYKWYHDNGILNYECKIVDGKRDSIRTVYDSDGEIKEIQNYNNGNLNGRYWAKTYRGIEEGNYKDDVKEGEWNIFSYDGIKHSTYYYENGKCGLFIRWWPNGEIREKGYLKDETKIGKWEVYDKNGKKKIIDYDEINLIKEKYKDENMIDVNTEMR